MQRGAFTISEFAEWSRIGRTKIYELIQSGDLPVVKLDTKTLIRVEDAQKLLDNNLVGAGGIKGGAAR